MKIFNRNIYGLLNKILVLLLFAFSASVLASKPDTTSCRQVFSSEKDLIETMEKLKLMDRNFKDKQGYSFLDIVAQNGYEKASEILLEKSKKAPLRPYKNKEINRAIHLALASQHPEVAKQLIDYSLYKDKRKKLERAHQKALAKQQNTKKSFFKDPNNIKVMKVLIVPMATGSVSLAIIILLLELFILL